MLRIGDFARLGGVTVRALVDARVGLAQTLVHGRLLTVHVSEHGAVFRNPCVDSHVVEYLLDLGLPAPGADC